ncbi:MAG TPA: exopolysaccharide biosynthesis protein [Opitutaceae bacterium]
METSAAREGSEGRPDHRKNSDDHRGEGRHRRRSSHHPPRKLSEELALLQARSAAHPLTLRAVIAILRGRGYMLLLILLSLPFITPIPLPGLSTPFGLAIALIALRLALGQRPWLPKKLQRREVPRGFFTKVLALTTRVIRVLEKFLRPRLTLLTDNGHLRQLHATLMLLAALALLLPLPIPFSNTFPAWVVLLMAGGLLERDGVCVLLAYIMFAGGVLFFVVLGEAAQELFENLKHWLLG